MHAKRMKITWLLWLALAVSACGLKESLEDVKRTDAAIKTELGLDAHTSWESTNGHGHVQVRLAAAPPGDATLAKRDIAAIVTRTFRSRVEQVEVAY